MSSDSQTVQTHLSIDRGLCGEPVALGPGTATVRLHTRPDMAADPQGLVHGGFVFGAADYAAMLAVNDPFVVLGTAELRFTAPVQVGETVILVAERGEVHKRRHLVEVKGMVGEREVFTGKFVTHVLERHVLDPRPDGA